MNNDLLCLLRIETEFDTTFDCCTDITKGKGNATRGQCRSGTHQAFFYQHGISQFVEYVDNQIALFFRCIMCRDKSHAAQYFDSSIRHDTEQRRRHPVLVTGFLCKICIQCLESDSCGYWNDDLFVGIEYSLYLVDNFFHPPGFYCNDNDVGSFYGFDIVGQYDKIRIGRFDFIQCSLRLCRTGYVRCFEHMAFCQSMGNGATDIPGSDNSYFHVSVYL